MLDSFDDMKEHIKQELNFIQGSQPDLRSLNFNLIIEKIFRSEYTVQRLSKASNFIPTLRLIMRDDIIQRLSDECDKNLFRNSVFDYKLGFLFKLFSHDFTICHQSNSKKGFSNSD